MSKARTLADFISDGSEFADGTISVAEVSGAAPLASPTFTGTASGTFSGPLTGNVTGNVTGDLTGDVTGNVTGNLTGNVTGDVAGDIDLSAISATIADTAVDIFVYDTRKDSDGGAWRKRTQHTSWYNETLNTATRGSRKEFPAVAVIVVQSDKIAIYDGDDPDLPMWMIADDPNQVSATYAIKGAGGNPDNTISCVSAMNGKLITGGGGPYSSHGVIIWDFILDKFGNYSVSTVWSGFTTGNLADRQSLQYIQAGTLPLIIDGNVNDVAMTVLPNAPIDAATGLPVPTIAVATNGGVSVIKDDGTVVDITFSSFGLCSYVSFTDEQRISFTTDDSANQRFLKVYDIPSSDISEGFGYDDNTALESYDIRSAGTGVDLSLFKSSSLGGTAQGRGIVGRRVASTSGLGLIHPNTEQPSSGMAALITSDYNTGWMNGDIKLATLSDTDATNVTGSELVTNGTFDTDTTGWTQAYVSVAPTTFSSVSGQLVARRGDQYRFCLQQLTVEVGKTYTVSVDSPTGDNLMVGKDSNSNQYGFIQTGAAGTGSVTFTATQTALYIMCHTYKSQTTDVIFDNISVRLAEEDRSVNGNGLQVFGTVTKSAVSSGADLVAYSGFSGATNLLETALSDDFAVGTGDFCTFLWAKFTGTGNQNLITVWDANSGTGAGYTEYFQITSPQSGQVLIGTNSDGASTTSASYNDGNWHQFMLLRRNSVLKAYIDGKEALSMASTRNFANPLRITLGAFSTQALQGSISLFRFSKTAPSPEQIKKIYEDEKVLFQDGAQATLYGESDAVTALAYDDSNGILSVGTSAGRSDFQGLRRVNNTTNAVGAAISASNGLIVEE
jgi:hypothetical protein